MNHLQSFHLLKNRYFVLRHGFSKANASGIIVSHPTNGVDDFGLSDLGREQVESSLRQQNSLDANTIIISSDFLRTCETAKIAHEKLGCVHSIRFDKRLRERNFGEFELTADSNYASVWEHDRLGESQKVSGVEAAYDVMRRVTELIVDCETEFQSASVLLVSHGDALQILQAAFTGIPAAHHRDQQHLETAQIRRLDFVPDSETHQGDQ